jgi:hypothetical protein
MFSIKGISIGVLIAAALTVIAIAVWPASATETARADGKQVGEAVTELYNAQSSDDVEAAQADLQTAISESRDHAGDYVGDQVNRQYDALSRAADGFVGTHTTDSEWDAELYQSELDVAIDDLSSNADNFRTEGPEVQQAFWNGLQDGLNITTTTE